jgi:hypothetical protein
MEAIDSEMQGRDIRACAVHRQTHGQDAALAEKTSRLDGQ